MPRSVRWAASWECAANGFDHRHVLPLLTRAVNFIPQISPDGASLTGVKREPGVNPGLYPQL